MSGSMSISIRSRASHFAAFAVPFHVFLTAAGEYLVEFGRQFAEFLGHRGTGAGEVVAGDVERRSQCCHR